MMRAFLASKQFPSEMPSSPVRRIEIDVADLKVAQELVHIRQIAVLFERNLIDRGVCGPERTSEGSPSSWPRSPEEGRAMPRADRSASAAVDSTIAPAGVMKPQRRDQSR